MIEPSYRCFYAKHKNLVRKGCLKNAERNFFGQILFDQNFFDLKKISIGKILGHKIEKVFGWTFCLNKFFLTKNN